MIKQQKSPSRLLGLVRTVTLLGLGLCTLSGAALGQTAPKSTQRNDALDALTQERTSTTIVQPAGVALEAAIDPAHYFVGPSDIIAVNIWMSPPVNTMLTVTPEGTLIVPTVGEIRVSDLTLADVKERVLAEVRKKYSFAPTTVTLIKPRPIIITVTGNVIAPGLYTLSSIDRATRAIEEANRTLPSQTEEQRQLLELMSTRSIVIKHKDGTQGRVDITKFLATREDRWNPYLREGDIVVIPRKSRTKNVFGIYGEVNAPGRYEYVEGDSLLDAVRIAQGFTRLALADSVEFSRLSTDGATLSMTVLDLRHIFQDGQPNFPLEPSDRIVVKAKIELREDYRVTIEGEVLYPGTYPIAKNHTTLSSLVRQAGGFTAFAALKSSEIVRRSVLPKEMEMERLMSFRGGVPIQDTSDYSLETEIRVRKEIVNVDFEKLFAQNDTAQDVLLQTDDQIIVPSVKKTVYVFGQVVSPGHIPYVTGKDYRYYIGKARGITDRARGSDIKVIKDKTKQWLDPGDTVIEDGDYIWVPKDPERPFGYYTMIWSQVASVLSVIIGIAVVVIQVTK